MISAFTQNKLTVYTVPELSKKMKFLLFFRRKHTLVEQLDAYERGTANVTYLRYSTYKVYKKERIYLSSEIKCMISFKIEEDSNEQTND